MSSLSDEVLESIIHTLTNEVFTGGAEPEPPAGGFWERTYPHQIRPVIVISVEDDADENVTPQRSATCIFTIRAISETSYAEARSFLKVIEAAFWGNVLGLVTWRPYNMEYLDDAPTLEEERAGGEWFYMVGDRYTLYADKEGM